MKTARVFILLVILGLASIPVGIRGFDLFSPISQIETKTVKSNPCDAHGLESGKCPFCDSRLIETEGFCKGHGVPEALCHRCRPELEAAFRKINDWCSGHNIPESQCEPCNPGILNKYRKTDASEAKQSTFFDDFDDPDMFPRYKRSPSIGCTTHDMRVTFPDAKIPSQAGIQSTQAIALSLSPELKCDAVTDYNRRSYTQVSSPAAGILRQVSTDLGEKVNKGDILAVIDSEEFGAAKADFLEADIRVQQFKVEYDRAVRLFEKQIISQKDMFESKARADESRIRLSSAKQRLANFGLTEDIIRRIKTENDTSSSLPIVSPLSGVVVRRNGVAGEVLSSSSPLFDITAVDTMWVLLNVYEPDLTKVKIGQKVLITLSGLEGVPVEGNVSWISTEIDTDTRSLAVRADVENKDGRIKSGMFGTGRILLENNAPVTGIPVESVQWDGCCNMVFVKINDLVYAPRKIQVEYRNGDYYAVTAGVEPGEEVVTQGSFILKTEILKNSIGAGCCPES